MTEDHAERLPRTVAAILTMVRGKPESADALTDIIERAKRNLDAGVPAAIVDENTVAAIRSIYRIG